VRVDFHTHSTGSDGTNTPHELLKLALEKNIQYLSITDHDTLDGIKALDNSINLNKLKFIPGVEISAEFPSTLHLLGYGFDIQNKRLNKVLEDLQDYRKERNVLMIENMQKFGFHITLEELQKEAGGELIGRPHFASLMVKKNYVRNKQEAFDKYLKKGAPLYLDKKRLDPKDAILLIKDAGGVVVIAHPYQTKLNEENLESLIEELVDYGLDGIEAVYPLHTKEMTEKYKSLAQKYDLFITAGSDYHGANKNGIELGINVGEQELEPFLNILSMF